MSDGDPRPPGSSWRRWVGDDPAADPDAADLDDMRLDWPAGTPLADDAGAGSERDELFTAEPPAELMPVAPLLPAIAGRVDALDGHLRALSMRIDLLASSIASVRSAIGERIDGYAETAAATARHADQALEEHRRTTERAVAELRRSVAATDEVLRHVAARVDEIATDVTTVLERAHPQAAGPDAVLLDALADVADRVAAVEASVTGLAERPEPPPPPPPPAPPPVDLGPVEDRLTDIEGRLGDLAALTERAGAQEPPPPPPPVDLAPLEERLRAVEQRLAALADRPEPPAPVVDLDPLARALDEIRLLVEVVVDTMPASAEGSAADLPDRVADAVVARVDPAALADGIANRLEQRFEVIVEPGGE